MDLEIFQSITIVKTSKFACALFVIKLIAWPHQGTNNNVFLAITLDQVPTSFWLVVTCCFQEVGIKRCCGQIQVFFLLGILNVSEVQVVAQFLSITVF
jgi:hypothetical protein